MPLHTKDARVALGRIYEDLWVQIQHLCDTRAGYKQVFTMLLNDYLWTEYLNNTSRSSRIAKFNSSMQEYIAGDECLLFVSQRSVKSTQISSPYWIPSSSCWDIDMLDLQKHITDDEDEQPPISSSLTYFAWAYASVSCYIQLETMHKLTKALSDLLGDGALATAYTHPFFDERASFSYGFQPECKRARREFAAMKRLYGDYSNAWFGESLGGPNTTKALSDLGLRQRLIDWVNREHDRLCQNEEKIPTKKVSIVTCLPDGLKVKLELTVGSGQYLHLQVHTRQIFTLHLDPDEIYTHAHCQTYELIDWSAEESEVTYRLVGHDRCLPWATLERPLAQLFRKADYRVPRAIKLSGRSRGEDTSAIECEDTVFTGDAFVRSLLRAIAREKIPRTDILALMAVNGDNGREPTPLLEWVLCYLHTPVFQECSKAVFSVVRSGLH